MKPRNETFPSGLEAAFLIVGLFVVEYLIGALLHDVRSLSGVESRDIEGAIVVLGNGVMFSVLLHYKQLSYASLFHTSKASVVATMGTLALPILFIIPALILVVWAIEAVLVAAFPLAHWEQAMFERMMSGGLPSAITVCLLAPVLEEMLFRGIVLRSFLHQYSRRGAIVGSAALFGLAHLNIYQFAVGLIVGCILGWLYERARSLWPCIFLHASYNSAMMLIYHTYGAFQGSGSWQPSIAFWMVAFVLGFFGAFLLQRLLVVSRVSPRSAL
jgi:membrane protease YdiL (CAAX protease family)